MRNFTAVKAGKGGTGDYAEYLLKEEALKKSSEYYVEGEKTAATSVYIGSKSAKLGLHGEISLESAKELLAGYTPEGTRIRGEKTSGEEILAHDNTLSAPKSVSIHCAEDIRLLDCHIAAVQQTIAALEKHYCVQRIQKNGIRTLEKGDGFVGWMTHHWTSRESEIDLHTHIITMNGCMGPDGKWRAVEDHQMSKALWIGSIYRNYLGQQVQGIGYKIREKKIEGKGYSFDLEGYTDKDIDEFSTRHKQISEAKNKGLGDREAWYTTRKGKEEEISLGELFEKTLERKAEIGCIGQSFPTSMNLSPIGKTDAKAIVNSAIAHLSRGSCKFSQADILAESFDHIERVKLKDVEQAIAQHPELVDYGVIRGIDELKGQYTTAATLERETRIIDRWMKGQGQATPIMEIEASGEAIAHLETLYKVEWQQSHDLKLHEIRAKIADGDMSKRTAKKLERLEGQEFKGLNKGQLGAVQGILATDNRNAIVYGLSGVGKTKSLRPTKDILDDLDIDTLWLAPSLAAAAVLSADVGQEAYTLQRFAYTDSVKVKPGQLVFVDESGLADALTFDLAAAKTEAAGGRLILIGDHKQNQPIQAGSPLRSLMDHGAEVFKISEILRQQDPIQKRAVELIAEGKGVESFALLSEHGYVTEIQDPEQRQDAIADQYLGLPAPDQKNTLLITGTNAERLALTEKIRQGQKDAGILGKSLDCTQLEDSRLSPEQLTDLRNYEIGDYVAPIRDYAKGKRHEFCKVLGKTETHLLLESLTGSTFELDPERWDKKLYTAGTINVAVGDELRLRGNIHGKDFQNGQIFTVKEIEGTIATLQGKKGKTRTIDLSRPVPVDHNIVRTTFDVQGSDKEGAILSLTDDRTSNQGSTYVGISRQFEFLTIYTQNYDSLLKRVSRECDHANALDLLELNYGHSTSGSFEPRDGGATKYHPSIGNFARGRGDGIAGNDGQGRGGIQTATEHQSGQRHSIGNAQGHNSTGSTERGDDKHLERSIKPTRPIDSAIQTLAQTYLRTERVKNLTPALQQFGATLKLLREAEGELRDAIAQRTAIQSANAEKMAVLMGDHPPTYKVVADALAEWRELRKTQPELKAETVLGRALMERTKDSLTEPSPVAKVRRWPEFVRQVPDKPKLAPKFEVFWAPDYSKAVRPEHIELKHWLEMQESGIHPGITAENVRSVDGQTALRYLLEEKMGSLKGESDQYATNPVKNILNRYENLLEGGWWSGSGVDPKTLGSQVKEREWGAFKPDKPRLSVKKPLLSYRWQGEIADEIKEFRANTESMAIALLMESGINANKFMDFKTIKYEHPPGPNRGLFLPKVPDELAQKIYAKYGITPTQEELKDGFWGVVKAYPQIPIVLNEGYKKTAATTSQGFAAVGGSGINGFYRANDENDRPLILRELHPDLAVFAVLGREFIIALDEDNKISTIWDVRRDTVRTAELLEGYGSTCRVAHWDRDKGNDDLIVQQGPAVYIKALNQAAPVEGEKRIWYRAEYNKIATQVRRDHPGISAKDLEVETFLVARGKGDAKDCDRFMSQSDNIRKLENPSDYLTELRAITTQGKQDNRLIAQPEAIQESLLWLDLIIARYGTEDEDLILGDWTFSKDGGHITATKDGEIGLEKRNGMVIRFAPELQGQLKTAIAAMQPETQRTIDNSFSK